MLKKITRLYFFDIVLAKCAIANVVLHMLNELSADSRRISNVVKKYSKIVNQVIANQRQRYSVTLVAGAAGANPLFVNQHFTVANETVSLQAVAWSDYVGRILDTPVSREQRTRGFKGEIDTYVLKDMMYLDSRTDPLSQARTNARISRDSVRNFVFHVAVEGIIETVTGSFQQRKSAQFMPGILALDMGQPMRMMRPTSARVLAFFLPRAMVEAEIPDAESIHGRVITYTSPLTRLILDHLMILCNNLPNIPEAEAEHAIRNCAHLILAAFGKQMRMSNSARAAAQFAMRWQIQHYIQANLHQKDLSPESILRKFSVSRPTLYRLFESEGGLGNYIRNCRLRIAAEELVGMQKTAVMEIAYGLGFGSPSDFTRAFRRAYGMSPQDFRMLGLDMLSD
jgi:AraC-like DNA-binding protein